MIFKNILETIGKTPHVKINNLVTKDDAEIVAKLEFFNPGGSVKDRIGLSMIEEAERRGILKEGDVIIEPTSGNTGIALAMVAAVKGYEAIFTMPDTMSIERRSLLQQFGAKIVLTPGVKGMIGAVEESERLSKEHGYFMPQQFKNPANPRIHKETTAREIWEALEGRILDYFVVGVGTGGTITGAGEILKERYPNLRIVAVEPFDSPVLSGGSPGSHKIQGIGAGFIPEIYNKNLVDEVIKVKNEEAFETAKKLARKEGILGGISTGANLFAALRIAQQAGNGKLILVIFPDTGERYISTDLFR